MTSPTLEPFRKKIIERLQKKQSKPDILKWLRQQEHVTIGNSQYYNYVKQLDCEPPPPVEEEPEPPPLCEVRKPEPTLEDDALRAFLVELPQAVKELTERLAALERTAREHEHTTLQALRAFQETLASLSKQIQEQTAQPTPPQHVATKPIAPPLVPIAADTVRKVWKRAFWINCVVWGLLDLLIGHGYWRLVWAAIGRAL